MSFFLHLEFYEFFKMQKQSCRCHYNQDVSITLSSSFMSLFSQSFPCLQSLETTDFFCPYGLFLVCFATSFFKIKVLFTYKIYLFKRTIWWILV